MNEPDVEALIAENRALRMEIAQLSVDRHQAMTFEGRSAQQWARYAREAEEQSALYRTQIRGATAHLVGGPCS